MNIESRIRAFIGEHFGVADAGAIDAEHSLLDAGILDSMGVLSLVTWLEQEFGFLIDDDDVLPENLDGIARLVAFVERKRAATAGAG